MEDVLQSTNHPLSHSRHSCDIIKSTIMSSAQAASAASAMQPNNLAADLKPLGSVSEGQKYKRKQSLTNHSLAACAKTKSPPATSACYSLPPQIRKKHAQTWYRGIRAVWQGMGSICIESSMSGVACRIS
nr:hypothetical protein CFP56_22462 [Quercus suber]